MTTMTRAMTAGVMGMLALAAPASATDFGFQLSLSGRDGGHIGVTVRKGDHHRRPRPVVVRPVVEERVWVPPVYRDVVERVWVPTVETRYRDVPVVDAAGEVIEYRREAYTVETGHYKTVTRRELVREGFWRTTGSSCQQPQRRHYSQGTAVRHRPTARPARPAPADGRNIRAVQQLVRHVVTQLNQR